jgi:hypothetical protein
MSVRGVSRPLKHVNLQFFNHILYFLEVWQEQGHAGKFHHCEKFFLIAGTIL